MEFKVERNKENKHVEVSLYWPEPAAGGKDPFVDKILRLTFYDSEENVIGEFKHPLRAQDQGRCIVTVPRLDRIKCFTYLDIGPNTPVQCNVFMIEAAAD